MVLPDGAAAIMIDVQQQRIADFHRPLHHLDQMSEQVAGFFLRIGDGEPDTLTPHLTGIADLAAAFAVKRRLVHDHRAALALFQFGNFLAVLHKSNDLRLAIPMALWFCSYVLLLRFYELETGRILIDGQDISAVTQESLRAKIAMVTQDTSLMHRSI